MTIVYQNGIAGKVCANPKCGWKPLSEFHRRRILGIPAGDGYKSRCKECWNTQAREERNAKLEHYRATQRKYVEAHQDHYRELKQAHQKAHPEKYVEAQRRYGDAHREERNLKAKERRRQNLEHYREIGRKSYERHADERRKYSIEYFKQHPEKSIAANNRRRALKLAAEGSHTEEEWQKLKAFYGYKCLCCGKQEPKIKLTRDHLIPLTQGGSDSIDNIQPLCAHCNSSKTNRHIDYR